MSADHDRALYPLHRASDHACGVEYEHRTIRVVDQIDARSSCVSANQALFCRRDILGFRRSGPARAYATRRSCSSLPCQRVTTLQRAPGLIPADGPPSDASGTASCVTLVCPDFGQMRFSSRIDRRRTARRQRFRTLRGTRIRDLRLNLQARSFATHRRINAVGHTPPPTVPRSSNCSTRNWSPPCAPLPVAPNSDQERADHARHRNPVRVRSRARFNKGGQVSEAVARLYCRARNTVINASPGHDP